MDAFLAMVQNGEPNECTVRDARAALVMVEAAPFRPGKGESWR